MKTKLSIFILFLIIGHFEKVVAKIDNKIVLKVENEIITNFEVKNKILSSLMLSGEELNQDNINKYKKSVLNLLLDNRLKKIEVSKYGVKKNDTKVNSYLKKISPDISELKKSFLNNNIDFQLYLDEITIEFMWQDLIYKIYSKKIDINESVIDKEINDYIKNNSDIKELKISEIEITLDNEEQNDKKILEVANQIKLEGFENTALKFRNQNSTSLDGDLGWINAKSLSPDIYKVLNIMEIGEVTQAIKKQNSVIFLKIDDKRISKSENIDINKLKKNLLNKKRNEQFDLYSRSHLSKLRNTSLIEYK
jgi:peptidyl-prolyl cis-trans isomerase SurA